MPLSINEFRSRAANFALEWKDAEREEADSQSFLNEFFAIFGIPRKKVALFEKPVIKSDESKGYIDLFWKGMIIVEMKSRGKDLLKAYQQAKAYADALPNNEAPRVILVCDFHTFHYYDMENDGKKTVFTLSDLPNRVDLFTFLAGYQKRIYKEQDPVNIDAAELMGQIHDQLKAVGYSGHDLEVYLVRILFCMFADDTAIFGKDDFLLYLKNRTEVDGSDLGSKLDELFLVLNKPEDKRLKNLDEQLSAFPYINGDLFSERLDIASFDAQMRETLLQCCQLDWGKISPAIFGAMFQSVMNPEERRNLGAHYTSEKNIMKVIHPLFLDELWDEFRKIQSLKIGKTQRLDMFHRKLAELKFLDPACGCGNFLVLTYRELRRLEIAVLKERYPEGNYLDVGTLSWVNVDQFYGIEIEEFPAQIAKVALWLMDHQMNLAIRDEFGSYQARIPLRTAPTIKRKNALPLDWETIVPKSELNYILGNPPFGGARIMSREQKNDLVNVFHGVRNNGNLDFVTCWYQKATEYIKGTDIEVGFVSTNSIVQGEQVPILWQHLFSQGVIINFAHQTFKWSNEARANAAVYCVIIGFALHDKPKRLFLYQTVQSDPHEIPAKQLNAYLVDAPNLLISSRTQPLCDVPNMGVGCQPIDDGNYLFTLEEKEEFLRKEPKAKNLFRLWYGSSELINNRPRYCLFLKDCPPNELKQMPECLKRVEAVKRFRLSSNRPVTRELANTPRNFAFENMPTSNYLLVPRVSSERRKYIPIGFMSPDILSSDSALCVPNATLYHFGVLTSGMHMAWTRYVCGRLKSDYRYSASIVYNNFPWPEPTDAQKEAIQEAAQGVLDARERYPDSSLADLYDPDTMPRDLLKAHEHLDRLVERSYRQQKFDSDSERVAFLFERYQSLTQALFGPETTGGRRQRRRRTT